MIICTCISNSFSRASAQEKDWRGSPIFSRAADDDENREDWEEQDLARPTTTDRCIERGMKRKEKGAAAAGSLDGEGEPGAARVVRELGVEPRAEQRAREPQVRDRVGRDRVAHRRDELRRDEYL